MDAFDLLREREKELDCIYSICLLAASAPTPAEAAAGVAQALVQAMGEPEKARCSIVLRNGLTGERIAVPESDGSPSPPPGSSSLLAELGPESAGGWEGSIELSYAGPGVEFLPQEKILLDSVLVVVASMLRTASLFHRLRATTTSLEAKNTALREVLSTIEEERARLAGAYRERLASDLLPLAERAADPALDEARKRDYAVLLIAEIRRQMRSIGSGPETDPSLSPREREIGIQVRNGRTSKEIAELLGIAEATVERHRHNIRRKLKLKGKGINLASLLSNEGQG